MAWHWDGLPLTCVCGHEMTTHHALTCPCGGYPQHDMTRFVTLSLAPCGRCFATWRPSRAFFPGRVKTFRGRPPAGSPKHDWTFGLGASGPGSRMPFFDVRVTHPEASLLSRARVLGQMRVHEQAKKRRYCARVNNVERGSFTPLVFTTSGMCAPECDRTLKNLGSLIVRRHSDIPYSIVMGSCDGVYRLVYCAGL